MTWVTGAVPNSPVGLAHPRDADLPVGLAHPCIVTSQRGVVVAGTIPHIERSTRDIESDTSRKPGPKDLKLVVDISDSSLASDRAIKSALDANAGIPEYWIVNLVDMQLEVYREPVGNRYAVLAIYISGDVVEPLHVPGRTIAVSDFMP